jgi:hypothetical protein
MAVYKFMDNKTGNVYTADFGDKEPTEEDFNQIKQGSREEANRQIVTGNYGYIGHYDRIKLPKDERRDNLAKQTAILLDVPISSVDASDSPLGIFARMGLSFRATPEEKYQALVQKFKTETNPNPIKRINVGGQERLILEHQDEEGQSKYSYIDEEGFSWGDIADYAKDAPAIAASTAVALALAPKTGGTSMYIAFSAWGLKAAAGSAAAYGATSMAQDLAIKAYDDAIVQDDFNWEEYSKYSIDRAGVRSKEAVTTGLIDLATMKTFGLVASRFGSKGADDAVKQINESIQRLNTKYVRKGERQLKKSNVATEAGLEREKDAVKSSGALRNLYSRNREILDSIMNVMKTGDTSNLREIVSNVANRASQKLQQVQLNIGDKVKGLNEALQGAYDRSLARNGINGFFDAESGGEVIRNIIMSSKKVSEKVKNELYEATFSSANKEGISYGQLDVIRTLQRKLNAYRGKLSIGFQEDIVSSLNKTLGTNLRSINDLFDDSMIKLIEGKKLPDVNLRQLDAIIKGYSDKANFGKFSVDKSQDEIVAEMMSNSLRKLRDSKLFDGSGKPINKTGTLQGKANDYYNEEWLRFYRYLGGKAIEESSTKLPMTGAKLMDSTLSDLRQIDELIKLAPDSVSRNEMLALLRQRYFQTKGADGNMLINSGNKISYDTNQIRVLFGRRNQDGKLVKGKGTEDLVQAKANAIDKINKISSLNSRVILEIPAADIKALLSASSKKQVDDILEKISSLQKSQARESELLKAAMPKLASSGELSANPHVYIKTMMEMGEAELKEVMDIVKKLDNGESIDAIRAAYMEQLFLLSKKGDIGVSVADSGLMIKNLKGGTKSGVNAEIILGKERVRDLSDWFRVADYSKHPTKILKPEVRGVMSNDNVTWVTSHITEPIQRKLWGIAATQGWLAPLARSATPEEFAYRTKSMLPWLLTSSSTLDLSLSQIGESGQYASFWVNELDKLNQNKSVEQPSEGGLSPQMNQEPNQGQPAPPQGSLPQGSPPQGNSGQAKVTQENVHSNPLGL